MARIEDIEGIGPGHAAKLREAGISTVEALLEKGGTANGRKSIAQSTGISDQLVLRWVNHADLSRIKGVGSEMSELLEAAGVDSVAELAQRVPDNLHQKMLEVNQYKKLVRRVPTQEQVAGWVTEAGQLSRVVTY